MKGWQNRGFFLTLEGCDGAGKSDACLTIARILEEKNIPHMSVVDPGTSELSKKVREFFLHQEEEELKAESELLLLFAARKQSLFHHIIPALNKDKLVVSDRFTDATYAYQGGGRQIDMLYIQQLEYFIHPNFQPDLTLFLDVDIEIGFNRIKKMGRLLDRFEKEEKDFFIRVRDAYYKRIQENPNRFVVINANASKETVQEEIRDIFITKVIPMYETKFISDQLVESIDFNKQD